MMVFGWFDFFIMFECQGQTVQRYWKWGFPVLPLEDISFDDPYG